LLQVIGGRERFVAPAEDVNNDQFTIVFTYAYFAGLSGLALAESAARADVEPIDTGSVGPADARSGCGSRGAKSSEILRAKLGHNMRRYKRPYRDVNNDKIPGIGRTGDAYHFP
jgi:hypothetical protein